MYGDFTHPEYGSPLVADDLEPGLEFVVYNHELRQVIHRGTIASPMWADTDYSRFDRPRTTHKIIVERKNYRGQIEHAPSYASDMGLVPYDGGRMNPVNRTYRINRTPKHRAERPSAPSVLIAILH